MAGATTPLTLSTSIDARRTGISVSTVKGRCGPCCSTEPTGSTRMPSLPCARTFSVWSFSKLAMEYPHAREIRAHRVCRENISGASEKHPVMQMFRRREKRSRKADPREATTLARIFIASQYEPLREGACIRLDRSTRPRFCELRAGLSHHVDSSAGVYDSELQMN